MGAIGAKNYKRRPQSLRLNSPRWSRNTPAPPRYQNARPSVRIRSRRKAGAGAVQGQLQAEQLAEFESLHPDGPGAVIS